MIIILNYLYILYSILYIYIYIYIYIYKMTMYEFVRTYLTFIFVIKYYYKLNNINNTKYNLINSTKIEIIQIQKYFLDCLKIQYIPIILILCVILPLMVYSLFKLNRDKENVKIVDILFIYSLIYGLHRFIKTIIIIINNYDKSIVVTYGDRADITSRTNTIYKSLINDNEYSNIDIFTKIWLGPILFSIFIIILHIIIPIIFKYNKEGNNLSKFYFNKDNILLSNITIKDVIYFISIIIDNKTNK